MQPPEGCRQIGNFLGNWQARPVVQKSSNHPLARFCFSRQNFGAGNHRNGCLSKAQALKPARSGLRSIQMVYENDGIQQVTRPLHSHSERSLDTYSTASICRFFQSPAVSRNRGRTPLVSTCARYSATASRTKEAID